MNDDCSITRLDLSLFASHGKFPRSDTHYRANERAGWLSLSLSRCFDSDDRDDSQLPCLTLGLQDSTPFNPLAGADWRKNNQGSSPGSVMSSFSNSLVKAKRQEEVKEEEEAAEVELVRSNYSTRETVFEDEDESNPRKKLRLSKQQTTVLEECFKGNTTLNSKQKQELASQLNLRPRQVEVWFQNRRARTKLKQTEVECEILRKCCETLTEENTRLKKELLRLRSMKQKRIPSASSISNICPSCETSF